MNCENIQKVIDILKANPDRFDIRYYGSHRDSDGIYIPRKINPFHPCGSALCICGWVNTLAKREKDQTNDLEIGILELSRLSTASAYLGLSYRFAYKLFHPPMFINYMEALTWLSPSLLMLSSSECAKYPACPWAQAFKAKLIFPEYGGDLNVRRGINLENKPVLNLKKVTANDAIVVLENIINGTIKDAYQSNA